ncbi:MULTISPECIES: ABC transporter ATP-binding protein [Thermotoga]|uniref:ABC transporter n=2 Tax=Thermotoga neapolitana TaxID=2337 RepID=B9K9C3_THENN|nr:MULTISPECIES: ABC transporter ATP-binding protein [Thermotoga]AAC24218.1 ABC transporter [Thermotoga neapolitana]ACM23556.1 ABC transporter [Thermotoga neapolitana DSM 4359]AIY88861.1 ABC transporter [Thermotoga sp. Cell2]KFZ21184.1 ABC transporter [Thermotoga neapolitana LA10]KHC95623.1 ABC transporter [Thermotoga sp. Xyl54]
METLVEGKNLKAYYVLEFWGKKRTIRAVDNVSLKIFSGEIYGIAGESGCGKSTLLKTLLANLEPPLRLFGGELNYWLDSKPVNVVSLKEEERRRLKWRFISYIPQGSMHVLNPVKRIRDTFMEILKSHVRRQKETFLEMAIEHLKALGLPSRVLDMFPHQLSGGMRQRVTIALATLLKPRIILADEPTTALDVVAQRAVIQLIKKIQKELKNTIVLVTHDMGIHAQVTTRMAIMYAGKIVEEGPTLEIFKEPLHPYTRYLIQSLPRVGDKQLREGIPGSPPSLVSPPSGCRFHPRCPHATQRCEEEEPVFLEVNPGHRAACFLLGG